MCFVLGRAGDQTGVYLKHETKTEGERDSKSCYSAILSNGIGHSCIKILHMQLISSFKKNIIPVFRIHGFSKQ